MENTLSIIAQSSLVDEGVEVWQNGQDALSSVSDASLPELESSVDASSEVAYMTASEYDLGYMTGYQIADIWSLFFSGLLGGFAVALGVSLAAFAIDSIKQIFRKGVSV